jgi:hypothetical protein
MVMQDGEDNEEVGPQMARPLVWWPCYLINYSDKLTSLDHIEASVTTIAFLLKTKPAW